MKILVTGGCGFIGSNYILHVLKKYPNDEIINLDKLTYAGNKMNLSSVENNPRYTFVHGDICNQQLVDSLTEQCDAIIHFAAESHVDRSILSPGAFMETNIIGTYRLLEAARKCGGKRFHHISTDEVFGSLGETGKFSETTPYDPRSPYSASKASSDHIVRAYFHTYDLPVTLSNCTNNYGPYHFPEKLIPLLITRLLDGKKIPLYGTGENIRDWIFVEDHVAGVDAALRSGVIGETYCFGGNAEATNKQIAEMILAAFDLGDEMIEYVADRKGHDFRYAMDSAKAKDDLGWEPHITLSEGIQKTITWYENNEAWWRPLQEKLIEHITEKKA